MFPPFSFKPSAGGRLFRFPEARPWQTGLKVTVPGYSSSSSRALAAWLTRFTLANRDLNCQMLQSPHHLLSNASANFTILICWATHAGSRCPICRSRFSRFRCHTSQPRILSFTFYQVSEAASVPPSSRQLWGASHRLRKYRVDSLARPVPPICHFLLLSLPI
jgi:hypothetical protein